MIKETKKSRKALRIVLFSFVGLILILLGGFLLYTTDYYRSDETAKNIRTNLEAEGRLKEQDNLTIIYPKVKGATGLIFYPGGKVEDSAYIPLMAQLSEEGITCVLVHMPFHLAVFGINRADSVYGLVPEINNWYLSGHSLGGAMASSYTGKQEEALKGLILLAAYPVNDTELHTLSIYGSNDQVLNQEKLSLVANKVEIAGGNHAYYGNYGEQKGDGIATITREEQQKVTVELIMKFIKDTTDLKE